MVGPAQASEVQRRPAAVSARVRLAAAAARAALAVPGVLALDGGPDGRFNTTGAGERLLGVTCMAAPEGGYDVQLRLVCELVPLPALAERVRAAVRAAATAAGLPARAVAIVISDLAGIA